MNTEIVYNRTKIIATVGPASNTQEIIIQLIKEGVDVFRLNFSHGTHADHDKIIHRVYEANRKLGTHVALLMDLQGPKIRIGEVKEKVTITSGEEFVITTQDVVGDSRRVGISYKQLPNEIKKGDKILINDGKIELEVINVVGEDIVTRVLHGGVLTSRKGVNLPHSTISIPSLTDKDQADLEFGLTKKINWVALSFVRSATDIVHLRTILKKHKSQAKIIAKIEKSEALENIDAILDVTDAVMIARGDLGVEVWMGEVPIIQKQLIEQCNKRAKPVIVATQMMESMIENYNPTRAETNDVANAVIDGADALMLSAETATGNYPIEVVRSMMRTITSVEKKVDIYYHFRDVHQNAPLFIHDSLILTACKLAKDVNAKAIVGMTVSGYTAYKSSSHRPKANIFVFTGNTSLLATMNMVWGTRAYLYDNQTTTDDTIKDIGDILKRDGHLREGDVFISLASMPLYEHGRTNMMKINIA